MTLLIVDDNARMRRMLHDLLKNHFGASATIIECADGLEAVAAAQQHHPDWIFMDIRMPRLDGFASARAILQQQPSCKIVIVTSYDEPAYRLEARELGITNFVVKDNLFMLLKILENE